MLHGKILLAWNGHKIETIAENASNLYYMSDDQVYFMKTDCLDINGRHIEHSHVYLLEALFGSHKVSQIYEDTNKYAEILNFGVDNTMKRLMILSGVKNSKNRRDKFITLYDIDTEKIIYKIKVENKEIIGRLKSNLYNFVDGHIYYGNKVIKIRYDQIKHEGSEIPENHFFDHYSDILSLKNPNDTV